ncbi:hypothetical protein CEUSTIGMA_g6021.t1 [Chlamydomonas eustigma]|uniref:Uncharacterized protein n=1 Tax=Chlamydomonas eustigma TaxID=1157962 RepID=A0A250X6S0_9CHLO|nr:hypothetical protein CEUSTIGMA_g6021.t1 [Chlamydomonas eustigma]|eukprot:GAX78582.1 hypothetical protein CEUSTIGMA_g6021.t1 [Chlamydomonas eustigma]
MSLLAMPLIVVNLGCEMLYILDQRLKAQSIPEDKSCRVLQDVVRSMFDTEYAEKLFSPQEVYSLASTRKIFEKLAHSSIMRLSESSMDKLFDLMAMGVKYQLQCSQRLSQMLEVTQLHLRTITSMMTAILDSHIVSLITNIESLMQKTYGSMTIGQLYLVRQTLQRFFLDKRVKVSLFLQEGIQSSSGRLVLPSPIDASVGTVTTYSSTGSVDTQIKVKLKAQQVDPNEFFLHPVQLGSNLYNKEDRAPVVPPPRQLDTVAPTGSSSSGGGGAMPEPSHLSFARSSGAAAFAEEVLEKGGKHARSELDLLAALLIKPGKATAQAGDNFKLNLFGDDEGIGQGNDGKPAVLQFGSHGKNESYKQQAGLVGVMKSMNLNQGPETGGPDSLLDLMDGAS